MPPYLVYAMLGTEPGAFLVFARQAHYQKNYLSRAAILPALRFAGCVTLTAHPSQGLQVALLSPVSFPSSPAGCVGAAWPACLWLRPRCRLAHGPIPPPKLGRQENTRHSCAKVAAGGQAAGGGGRRRGPRATRTFGGLWARQSLQLEGHMFACVLVGIKAVRVLDNPSSWSGTRTVLWWGWSEYRRSKPPGL